jgi:hypothetical protein
LENTFFKGILHGMIFKAQFQRRSDFWSNWKACTETSILCRIFLSVLLTSFQGYHQKFAQRIASRISFTPDETAISVCPCLANICLLFSFPVRYLDFNFLTGVLPGSFGEQLGELLDL